jgi:hypothetical protein
VAVDRRQIGEESAAAGQKRIRKQLREETSLRTEERIHYPGIPEILAKRRVLLRAPIRID